ncbi:hypothetical protein BJ508DRAFT_77035 [Ascobolus immersus RN42]|uniref:Uncharacterized protein n=1 Tax=Ascobolus immersus RN42 TaxID=1160509 RepID=A0A3N4HD38_ASCIM|nr:hypothetical protein BJ508DRAFT_77035 [Ascobolus immersus RN42]
MQRVLRLSPLREALHRHLPATYIRLLFHENGPKSKSAGALDSKRKLSLLYRKHQPRLKSPIPVRIKRFPVQHESRNPPSHLPLPIMQGHAMLLQIPKTLNAHPSIHLIYVSYFRKWHLRLKNHVILPPSIDGMVWLETDGESIYGVPISP